MFRNLFKSEGGYSLPEVIVSILILTAAIVPMVGMFDAGLKAATQGGDYDKARALAKKQLESAQSLPYGTVRSNFPNAPCTFTAGICTSTGRTDNVDFPGFTYDIRKQFVRSPNAAGNFPTATSDQGIMQITVSVNWRGNTYRTTTIKVR